MGRPQKKGLDYFPLDVHMDDSIELLEVDYGLEGFAILIKLYQKIYSTGYYIHVSEREIKLLSRYINVDIDLLNNVIKSTIEYKIFDKTLFKKYQILTSTGIQKRYLFACERRLSIEFTKEYFLLGINVYINFDNVDIKELNVDGSGVNTVDSTHIKEKDIKENNISIVIDYFNSITGQKRRYSKTSQKPIHARLNDNFSIDDCKKVIDIKYIEWKDNKDMQKYITIETLFRPSNFEKYLNQEIVVEPEDTSGIFIDDYSPIAEINRKEYKELYGK